MGSRIWAIRGQSLHGVTVGRGEFIKERLDRVVANRDWCARFEDVEVSIGAAICSDHTPIFLNLGGSAGRQRRRRRPFSF